MGSKWVVHWTSETWWECSKIAGSPQGSPPAADSWLWSRKGDLQRAWNRDRKAVWDQVWLSHCRHEGRLRWGHRNDQICQGHQCSETSLTGEPRLHISPPQGFEPRPLWREAKGLSTGPVRHWWPWCDWSSLQPRLRQALVQTVTRPSCRQCDNPTWSHTAPSSFTIDGVSCWGEPCGEPAISLNSPHVSLVQWTNPLLPVTRDLGSIPWGGLVWNQDSPVSDVSLQIAVVACKDLTTL